MMNVGKLLTFVAGMGVIFVAVSVANGQFPQVLGQDNEETPMGDSIFVPAPREFVRPLEKAEEAIAEGELALAVDLLGGILEDDSIEDYFLPAPGGNGNWLSLKSRGLEILNSLPPRGRELFELKYGIEAKRLLEEAMASRDIDSISKIAHNYFHTEAGYEATLLLGRIYLDQGRYFSAVRSFQRIVGSNVARTKYTPEVQVLLATAWMAAGEPTRAEATLAELPAGDLPLELKGELVSLDRLSSDVLTWLTERIGPLPRIGLEAEQNWMMFRGNSQRLAESSQGFPLLINRWQIPAVLDAKDRKHVATIKRSMMDTGGTTIPSINPLAVGDYVLMRTPEHIVGVELKTGLRKWFYPWDDDSSWLGEAPGKTVATGNNPREQQLRERLWIDGLYGQPSSDGRRVFFVDDLKYRTATNNISFRRGGAPPAPPNRLVALQLVDNKGNSVEGKMAWIIGGKDGNDQEWSEGVFFLGAPLPEDDHLYVLGEQNGEIRLFVMDPNNADLLWSRQVATANLGGADLALYRRLGGASPSYADGVVICPTLTGAIVAIDLSTRTPLWGFQYKPVESGRRGYVPPQAWKPGEKWADGTVTIHNGKIIVTPVEQDKLHCVDLLTGAPVWSLNRDDMLYIGGIFDDILAMVGSNRVYGIELATGNMKWELPISSGSPSGRGYASEGKLFVPTTAKKILSIDLAKGELLEEVDTEYPLGNLICHNGFVVSHNVDVVAAFYQDESNRDWVGEQLQDNPEDLDGLLLKAQLDVRDKNWEAAVGTVKDALRLHPDSVEAEQVLVTTMMLAARNDPAFSFEPFAEYEPLVLETSYRSEFLMLKATQALERDDQFGVISSLLKIAQGQQAGEDDLGRRLVPTADGQIDAIRWARSIISEVAQRSGDQPEIQAEIQRVRDETLAEGKVDPLLTLDRLFGRGWRDEAFESRVAAMCVENDRCLEAEELLLRLIDSDDRRLQAESRLQLAQMLEDRGFPGQAQVQFTTLATEFTDEAIEGDLTGRQLLEQFVERQTTEGRSDAAWSRGKILVETSSRTTRGRYTQYPLKPASVEGALAPADLQVAFMSTSLFLNDADGNRLATVNVANGGAWQIRNTSSYSMKNHLLIFEVAFSNLALELVAVDMFKAIEGESDSIVWRQRLFGDIDTRTRYAFSRNNRPQFRTTTTNTSLGIQIAQNMYNNKLVGSYSAPQTDGLVYQRGDQLVCVDPFDGFVLWKREGIDVGVRCITDEQHAYVVSSDQKKVTSFTLMDGKKVAESEVDTLGQIFAVSNGTLVGWKPQDQEFVLKGWNLAEGELGWELKYPFAARAFLMDAQRLAILDPEGEFKIHELATGEPTFTSSLAADTRVQSIQVFEDDWGKLLVVNHNAQTTRQKSRQNPKVDLMAVPYSNPLVDGLVYSLDAEGRQTWPNPAVIDQYSLLSSQVGHAPILMFSRYYTRTQPNKGQLIDLVVIDRRDGQLIVDDRGIETVSPYWIMEADATKNEALIMGPREYTLKFSDRPIPPGPAAQTGYAASGSRVDGKPSITRVLNGLERAFDLNQ